jgi:hypothetical protein
MGYRLDNTGQRFGRLTALAFLRATPQGDSLWLCQCDCGNTTHVRAGALRSGHIRSCGCLKIEMVRLSHLSHGQAGTKLYKVWSEMKRRCFNPHDTGYDFYGGRGITVSESWQQFQPFYDWAMASGYREGLTIDRIDNDGNYEPGNCRWIPMAAQQRNSRRNHLLTFEGKTLPLVEWAETRGLSRYTLSTRLARHWPVEKALTQPVGVR